MEIILKHPPFAGYASICRLGAKSWLVESLKKQDHEIVSYLKLISF